MGFASSLHYCSNIAHWRPTKPCTMFAVSWAGTHCKLIYIFECSCPCRNFARCKIHFASKSCVLLYWQRYCTALKQRASGKIFGMLHGMELRNFRRGRHLYSAGWPSRLASAHILVYAVSCPCTKYKHCRHLLRIVYQTLRYTCMFTSLHVYAT